MNQFENDVRLRLHCAGYCKALIAARARVEPRWLTNDMRTAWRLETGFPGERPLLEFFSFAKRMRADLERNDLVMPGSLGPYPQRLEVREELSLKMFDFVDESALEDAIRALQVRAAIDWNALAAWGTLPEIRALLNQLPEASCTAAAPAPEHASRRVKLFGNHRRPVIDDQEVAPLTTTQYQLIAALIGAGDLGCKKAELECIAAGARETLRRLQARSDLWNAVIRFPGTTGGRYRIL